MKKLVNSMLFLASFAFIFAGCTKNELTQEPTHKGGMVYFSAEASSLTKVSLTTEDDLTFTPGWEDNDAIRVACFMEDTFMGDFSAEWDASNNAFGSTDADDYFDVEASFVGVYPNPATDGSIAFGDRVQDGNTYNGDYDVMISEPVTKTLTTGSKIALSMDRQTAIAYFHITSDLAETEKVESATLTVTGGNIAGSFLYSESEIIPVENGTSIKITFTNAPSANDFKLWFNVIPTEYTAMQLEIKTTTKTATITKSKAGEYEIGQLYEVKKEITTWTGRDDLTKVNFSVNGEVESAYFAQGGAIVFPTDPEIDDVEFIGWAEEAITGTQDDEPDLVTNATAGDSEVTYYAVFATHKSGTKWHKTAVNSVTEGTYAIITTDGHAFNGTISSGHGQATTDPFSFTNDYAMTAPEGLCEITMISSESGFKMYNAEKGYLYAKDNSSGNLAWHDAESSYWLYESSNWIYNDNSAYLRSYNNSSIRTYAGTSGDVLIFAKKESYDIISGYTTSVASLLSIAISGDVTKKEYTDGDVLDPTGLTVKAKYSDNNEVDITNEVEWAFDPATLTEGTTACKATASYKGKSSSITINGLTVNAGLDSIEINLTNSGITGSYTSSTFIVDGITFGYTNWMKSSPNIQAKASNTNSLYNTTAIPKNIKKITVVQTSTARAIKIYGGTSSKPTTAITAPTTDATMVFDFTGKEYTYFSLTTPGNACYFSSITIEY